jgi:hypothetical protein
MHEVTTKAMVDIGAADAERTELKYPQNAIAYDKVLHILKSGVATPEFQANAIYAHDSFVRDAKLKDLVMHNAIYEHFAAFFRMYISLTQFASAKNLSLLGGSRTEKATAESMGLDC